MRVALLGLAIAFAGMQQNRVQTGVPASLSGYVLETTTGRPIGGAEVSFYDQARYSSITAKTEADGHFRFESIPSGASFVNVSKPGYISLGDRYAGRRITLGAGERRTDLILRIQGTGTLSGRIMDFNGRPVVQSRVRVFRFAYHELQREPSGMQLVSERNSDDRGEFRAFNVPSGVYFVLAEPPLTSPATHGAALYPGEREFSRAQRIEVRPEEETRLRDLTLPPPMRGSVRLHLINATGGPLPQNLAMRINAVPFGWDVSSGSDLVFMGGRAISAPGVDRVMQPTLVGSYVFHTAMQTAVGNVAGYAKVDYSGADVDVDFVVAKLEGKITGRVLLESASGASQPLAGAEMEFFGASAESNFSGKDGVFNIKGLLNGPYQFSGAFEMPKSYYVASVRERERDVLKEGLMVSERTPEVEVRVRADGGSMEGRVADSRLRPAPDAVIALIPQSLLQDRTDRHNTYRVEHSSATGVFELRDVIPGEYLVYAWSDLPEGAVMDPWFMEKYKGKGRPVRVEPGSRLKMDLTILDE